jgi:SAM-dependent methyltransferase
MATSVARHSFKMTNGIISGIIPLGVGNMTDTRARLQDSDYLRGDQYRDSKNLNARANLHRQYSTNRVGWHRWVFDLLKLAPRVRVLECGCGPGWLWRSDLDSLPAGCQVTLTDLSPGMVFGREWAASSTFGLKNGRKQLESWFSEITVHLYEDSLEVTEVEPLLAYISSSSIAQAHLSEKIRGQIRRHVAQEIATQGAFHITKGSGVFEALHPSQG